MKCARNCYHRQGFWVVRRATIPLFPHWEPIGHIDSIRSTCRQQIGKHSKLRKNLSEPLGVVCVPVAIVHMTPTDSDNSDPSLFTNPILITMDYVNQPKPSLLKITRTWITLTSGLCKNCPFMRGSVKKQMTDPNWANRLWIQHVMPLACTSTSDVAPPQGRPMGLPE